MNELTLEPNTPSTGAYNQNEVDMLAKAQSIRNAIVDVMTKDGVPESNRDIRLLNEVLTAMEDSIHTGVANRIKYVGEQNTANIQAMVVESLRQAALKQAHAGSIKAKDVVIDALPDEEIVPGEMEIEPSELIVSDFVDMGDSDDTYEEEGDEEEYDEDDADLDDDLFDEDDDDEEYFD